jgi:glucokinase
MDRVVIGVDLGGTILRAGAFDAQGKLLVVRETPIEAARGPESGLRKMQGLIEQVRAESGAQALVGIGIGSTGPVDPIKGLINNPFTLPTWENVQVFEWMEKAFNVPVTLENDADVAALGEYWQGAGRSIKRLYAVTVGTGIGTALILDGEIYRGMDGSHPEGGHMVLDPSGPLCYCKMRGCWESLCAGPGIERQAREADLTESRLLEMAAGERKKIETRMVFDAARIGDKTALSIVDTFTRYFIQGILNVCILFVPDVIVLSGGVLRSADLFMPPLERALQAYTEMVPAHRVHIIPAKLGYYAGLYGAAYTIWSKVLRTPYMKILTCKTS